VRNTLDGSVVIVTGAARGMGEAHVRGLVRSGARVMATDILDTEGAALAAVLGTGVIYRHHDVRRSDDWQRIVDETLSVFGRVDHLVNNAGVLSAGGITDTTEAEFRRVMDINLIGCWLGMRHTIAALTAAGGGSIVNISSTAGMQGYAGLGAYVSSKWALRGLTKTAALELGRHGIRVNSIHPGPISTPMLADVDTSTIVVGQPIARIGEPQEVTDLLLYVLADATYSTGHEFVIDGGATLGRVDPVVTTHR
jgi:3alpha(or 20beta)-hydroxysteroid dehydrogenase